MGITWLQMEEKLAWALTSCSCWPFAKANGEMRQRCRRLTLQELRGLPILSDLPTGDVYWYEMPHPMPNCKFSDCIWARGSWALSGFAPSDYGPVERRIAILDAYDKVSEGKRLIYYVNGAQFLALFKEIVEVQLPLPDRLPPLLRQCLAALSSVQEGQESLDAVQAIFARAAAPPPPAAARPESPVTQYFSLLSQDEYFSRLSQVPRAQ
jgi:hypothetical protein